MAVAAISEQGAERGDASATTTPKAMDGSPAGHSTTVVIVGARNLRRADWLPGFSSDPYCVCRVVGKRGAGFRTGVASRTQNPMWNVRGLPDGYEPGDDLEFEIFDKDTFKGDDLLGRAMLTSAMFEKGGFDGQLPLRDAGKGVNALLRIRVEVPAPAAPTPSMSPEASLVATVMDPSPSRMIEIKEYDQFMDGWCEQRCCGFAWGRRSLRM